MSACPSGRQAGRQAADGAGRAVRAARRGVGPSDTSGTASTSGTSGTSRTSGTSGCRARRARQARHRGHADGCRTDGVAMPTGRLNACVTRVAYGGPPCSRARRGGDGRVGTGRRGERACPHRPWRIRRIGGYGGPLRGARCFCRAPVRAGGFTLRGRVRRENVRGRVASLLPGMRSARPVGVYTIGHEGWLSGHRFHMREQLSRMRGAMDRTRHSGGTEIS